MDRDYILSIMYEMALVIGGEVSVKPLLTKTLQRLLYNTSFPAGFVCLGVPFAAVDSAGMIEVRIDAAVGDYELVGLIGQTVRLPAQLLLGAADRRDDAALLAALPGKVNLYKGYLRLPIDGQGVIVLLAPQLPESDLPLTQLFQPVMASLSKAIVLCKSYDAYTVSLIAARDASQQALATSEEKFKAISAAVLDALIMVDDSSALVYWNPAAERILGYRADEVLGKPLHQMLAPQRYQSIAIQGFNAFRSTGQGAVIGKTIEIEALHKDGHEISVELSISALKLNGRWHAVGILRDITEKKRMVEELHQASVYNRSLIEASMDPLVTISSEGKITDLNQATEKITGRSRSELIGTDFSDYFTEPDKAHEGYQQVFASGFVANYPLVLRHRDGHITDVLYNASVYRNEAGEVCGVFAAARDITERTKAEAALRESKQFLDKIVDQIPNMLFVKDAKNLKFVRLNKAGEKLLGYPQEELIGKDDYDFFPKEQADFFTSKDREIIAAKELLDIPEEIISARDLGRRYLHTKKIPIISDDGHPLYLLGISEDITERKQAQEEIEKLNRDLERRVAERTAQLEALNNELEAFSYSVSHDLRAPLRAIDGFSHILLEDYAGKLDDEGKRLLNVVRDNTSRMAQLIDDILKFSRTGRVEINFSEIDMEMMAREVLAELQSSDAGTKLQFEIEPIPQSTGDRAMMRQVLINLLSNAIKFSRARETPRIKVGGFIEGNEVVYYVKDNGAGFDMLYAGKLFGVFQRLHSADEFEGTGIGLAIVKRIINRHGGRVWAEGKINEGATIYFTLPQAARQSA